MTPSGPLRGAIFHSSAVCNLAALLANTFEAAHHRQSLPPSSSLMLCSWRALTLARNEFNCMRPICDHFVLAAATQSGRNPLVCSMIDRQALSAAKVRQVRSLVHSTFWPGGNKCSTFKWFPGSAEMGSQELEARQGGGGAASCCWLLALFAQLARPAALLGRIVFSGAAKARLASRRAWLEQKKEKKKKKKKSAQKDGQKNLKLG